MFITFRPRIRHPFFPGLDITPAAHAGAHCTAIAGTVHELLEAACRDTRAERAVLVVNRAGKPFLSEADRDRLWHLYQVPVFVVAMGDDGRQVLGFECEAQEGLHVAPRAERSLDGQVVTAPCECGRAGHRVLRDKNKDKSKDTRKEELPTCA